MNSLLDFLPLIFFLVAFVYSLAGFAGGSSYILFLTLAGFSHTQSSGVALLCNLIVSAITFYHFKKAGHFRWNLVWPFALSSIPALWLGSQIQIQKETLLVLLGLCFAIIGLRLLFSKTVLFSQAPETGLNHSRRIALALPSGALMGFFSGLIGIGGGIFLSPFLILTRWADAKKASAAAACFIFINSLVGLLGRVGQGFEFSQGYWLWILPALVGGWLGSRVGSGLVSQIKFERVLATFYLFLSANYLLKALC